jgi:hypothetical protein
VHQGTPSQTCHLRENSEALRYNSPDCSVYHRTVSGAPRESGSELATFGNQLSYNSPDMSGAHRTCPVHTGLSGEPAEQRLPRANGRLQKHLMHWRAQKSARVGGTPDSLQGLSGAPPDSQAGLLVRAPTVGTQQPGDVAGAPDCVSGAPCDSSLHQTASLVVGAINTPTTPPFIVSKFSSFQPLYKS